MNQENTDISTASLYVGNLHHSVTEAILFEKFSAVGPISFIHVCRHQGTQLPLGYGYVTFASTEHAERAIDEMNFDMVKGEMIRLLWTKSVPSLQKTSVEDTIRALKKHAHKRDIFELFTLFKNILNSSEEEKENYCTKNIILPEAPLNNDVKDDLSDAKKNEFDVPSINGTTSSFNLESNCVPSETGNPTNLDEVRRNLGRWKDSPDVKSIEPDLYPNDFTLNRCNATSNLMLNVDEGHLEDEGYQTIDENFLSYESNESTGHYSLNSAPVHIVSCNSTPARFASKQFSNISTKDFVKYVDDGVENEKANNIRYVPQRLKEINSDNERLFKNVYVKNFGDEMNKEDLFDLFHEFGPILNCEVMRNSDGLSRGFGFVNFERPQDAKQAVDALNGKMLRNGKQIYVSRAQKKAERITQLKKSFDDRKSVRQYQGTNLYVKNLDDSVDDSQLYDIFSQFGNITSAKVMKEQDHSKGFGFVCFSTPTEATKAVTEMNGTIVGSKPLYVALAQRKEDRQAHLASQCIQLLSNLKKQEKEPKDEDSELEPVTFEDLLLSQPPQVIPEFDDLLPIGPPSVISNITDSLSNSLNGGNSARVPYQLEHLPNPVPFPLSGLPKRKIGHYQIGGGHSRGPVRHSVNATSPPRNVSPQRWTHAIMTVPSMRRCNGPVTPERYEPRVEYTHLYTYHQNYPSFKQYGIGRGMIPHSYQTYNKPGIR